MRNKRKNIIENLSDAQFSELQLTGLVEVNGTNYSSVEEIHAEQFQQSMSFLIQGWSNSDLKESVHYTKKTEFDNSENITTHYFEGVGLYKGLTATIYE